MIAEDINEMVVRFPIQRLEQIAMYVGDMPSEQRRSIVEMRDELMTERRIFYELRLESYAKPTHLDSLRVLALAFELCKGNVGMYN